MGDLDRYDLAILKIIQNDCSVPQRLIGEQVNLSTAAVQRRIRRMEETGFIQSNIAVVDPRKAGNRITIIVEVELINERMDYVDEIKKRFLGAPQIQQCYYVAGAADFIIIMTVASMNEYEELTKNLFHNNENIRRYQTFVAMDRVKVTLNIPLAE